MSKLFLLFLLIYGLTAQATSNADWTNPESFGLKFILYPEVDSPALLGFQQRTQSYLLNSLQPFRASSLFHIPRDLKIHLLVTPRDLPVISPNGYSWIHNSFWMVFDQTKLNGHFPLFTIEFGRMMFLHSLEKAIPEYKLWRENYKSWLGPLCTITKVKIGEQIRCQVRPLEKAETQDNEALANPLMAPVLEFPWQRLIYDYEIGFGILFAAMAMRHVDPERHGDFFDHPFFEHEFAPEVSEDPNDYYKNHLRPALRWIWGHHMDGYDEKQQVVWMEKYFKAAAHEIKRRRQDERCELCWLLYLRIIYLRVCLRSLGVKSVAKDNVLRHPSGVALCINLF